MLFINTICLLAGTLALLLSHTLRQITFLFSPKTVFRKLCFSKVMVAKCMLLGTQATTSMNTVYQPLGL